MFERVIDDLPPLTYRRFVLTPEGDNTIRGLKNIFDKVKSEHFPEIKGLGFHGSFTLGKQGHYSDLDLIIFCNNGQNKKQISTSFIDRKVYENKLAKKLIHMFNDVDQDLDITFVDVSEHSTIAMLEEFKKELPDFVKSPTDFIVHFFPLFSRFFLCIGCEIYANRKFIFNWLKQQKNGDDMFSAIMDCVQILRTINSPREKDEHKKRDIVLYPFPKTIVEGEIYFLLQ